VTTSTLSVLLVDDHEVVRAGYHRLLESHPGISVVAQATTGEEACQLFQQHHPDVVVMDLTMPGISGLEASRRILAHEPAARILVFSVHENEVMLGRALDMGIKGYISKRSASRVMIEAVRQVAAGEIYIGQEMMSYLLHHKASTDSGSVAGLSTREFEVFQLLVDSKSVNEIADILKLSPKTVGHHVASIKSKLGISSIADMTRLAIRLGILSP
jgi:two-component system invasion response regulator UvrY